MYVMTEFHAHTKHSDGDFTTNELIEQAAAFGYKVLAITDHNTMAPVVEASMIPQTNVVILPGMEWTTFFGHLLTMGLTEMVDWREAQVETIDASLRKIKQADGIAGIAHPFSIGNPMCTGCHWDFHVEDYHLIDFVEVWNRIAPDDSFRSEQAYEWWIELLQQGYRIAASAGRDWHRMEKVYENTALTYLGMEEATRECALQNIKKGNYYITLGPRIDVTFEQFGKSYTMGDEVQVGELHVSYTIRPTEQAKLAQFRFTPTKIKAFLNETLIFERSVTLNQRESHRIMTKPGYLRIELWGNGKNKTNQRVCLVNPVYVRG